MKKFLLSILAFCGVAYGAAAEDAAADVTVLLDADFTVFTDGSEANPTTLYSSSFNQKIAGFNYASGVSSAGGKLLIGPSGYIEAKQFEALPTTGSATLRVTAEVKMLDSYGGCVQIKRGYSSDQVNIVVESDEWTSVTTYVSGYNNSSSSRMRLQPYLSVNGLYIKSLKVEYSPDFIAAPEAYLPSDADGTQFTATCSRVGGASKYEADVFSVDAAGNPDYFVQDVELKALGVYSLPEAKITGLDPATTYYYVVRAVNASGAKSDDSEPVKVVKKLTTIAAPEALAASNVTEAGFTANWTGVDDAIAYMVNTYSTETLTEAQNVNVFEEDFSGVTIGSLSSIEFSGDINDFTKVPGWETDFNKAYAAGYFVFSPYSDPGVLITPEIDLSACGGVFTMTINAATGAYGTFKATENTLTVELLEGEDVTETAAVATCDKTGFADFTFSFTKGTATSRLRITYTQTEGDSNKLFIDEISLAQMMEAGTVVTKQLASEQTEATTLDVKLALYQGKEYSYGVIAIGETVVGSGTSAAVSTIQSELSNKVTVKLTTTGIDEVGYEAGAAAWKEAEGVIGVRGSDVAVHDLMGRTLLHRVLPEGTHTVRLNVRGLVIVTVDGRSYKIVL